MMTLRPYANGKTILLTGASGVVGQALLEKLAGHDVVCVVRRTPVAGPGVTTIYGDITKPRLGLDRAAFHNLGRRIDGIIHAAAITDFAQPAAEIHRANVDGVRHVLDLAAVAQAPLYHISTAFVHPSIRVSGGQGAQGYQASKREAERLVRQSGLPATIVRPSIVVGDAQTGRIASFQGLHLMSSLLLKGLLPLFPISPQARLDFVPQDVVAGVIAGLIERGQRGGECWVTAGEQAPTVEDVLAILAAHTQRVTGRPLAMPRLISPAAFERLMRSAALPARARHLRRIAAQALELAMYCIDTPLPSSLPELQRRYGQVPLPNVDLTVLRNLEYWAAVTTGQNVMKGDQRCIASS